jgi:capsular polysaccharide biosynthesis protein
MTRQSNQLQLATSRYFGLGLVWRLQKVRRLLSRLARASDSAWTSSIRAWHRLHPPPIAASVLDWCQRTSHLPYEILLTPEPVHRKLPQTVEPEIHERYLKRLYYTPPVKYLTCIPGARLTGNTGWLVLPTGQYALELAYGTPLHLMVDADFTGPRPKRRLRMAGNYYSLLMLWARDGSYYHWVHDVMLRLAGILPRLPADVRFVVPANLAPYQRECLQAVGIEADRLVHYTGREEWIIERLYFSPPSAITGYDLPEADRWFRQRVREAYNVAPSKPSRRIFITRRASRGRSITNETDVEAYLRPLGFETIALEGLTFAQQVALFAEAKIVVGSHGAGFTNILFANAGLQVVECFEPGYVNTCFWTMSEALNLRYAYFMGRTVPAPGTDANIEVPIDKLRATLAACGCV